MIACHAKALNLLSRRGVILQIGSPVTLVRAPRRLSAKESQQPLTVVQRIGHMTDNHEVAGSNPVCVEKATEDSTVLCEQ